MGRVCYKQGFFVYYSLMLFTVRKNLVTQRLEHSTEGSPYLKKKNSTRLDIVEIFCQRCLKKTCLIYLCFDNVQTLSDFLD